MTNSSDERYQRGLAVLNEIDSGAGQSVIAGLADISPDFAHHIIAFGFGDLYSRPALVPQQRQLITLGILAALGGCEPELEVHIRTSLKVGLTPEQIVETFIHTAGYAGFPRAVNAIGVAKKIFAEQGLLPLNE